MRADLSGPLSHPIPDWVDAIWPDVQSAIRADRHDKLWRNAMLRCSAGCSQAWRDLSGGSDGWMAMRAALTVWWWSRGGSVETIPSVDEVYDAVLSALEPVGAL